MALVKLTIDTGTQTVVGFQSQCDLSMLGLDAVNNFVDYMSAQTGGNQMASNTFLVGTVKATGTLTLTSVVATNTFAVNGVTFTAVASGATGNQFNVGADDTATAVAAAAAVNASASALVSGGAGVTATSALGVVTVTARTSSVTGNAITLTGSANIAASGARLTGGSNGTSYAIDLS